MIPVQATLDNAMLALGATTVTFSPSLSADLFLMPVKVPFTPGPTVNFTDATDLADFAGSGPRQCAAAARTISTDPLVGGVMLNLPSPVGGWEWTTTTTANLPQTIYGVALGSDSATLESGIVATALLDEPVTLTAAGQVVASPDVRLTLIPGGIQ